MDIFEIVPPIFGRVACPYLPYKQPSIDTTGMSAKCQCTKSLRDSGRGSPTSGRLSSRSALHLSALCKILAREGKRLREAPEMARHRLADQPQLILRFSARQIFKNRTGQSRRCRWAASLRRKADSANHAPQ
jgi:hypothetical protein